MEETVVRDKAVESACVVIGLMQGGQQEVKCIPRIASTSRNVIAVINFLPGILASYKPCMGQRCDASCSIA